MSTPGVVVEARPVLVVDTDKAADYLGKMLPQMLVVGPSQRFEPDVALHKQISVWTTATPSGRALASDILTALWHPSIPIRVLHNLDDPIFTGPDLAMVEAWDVKKLKDYTSTRWRQVTNKPAGAQKQPELRARTIRKQTTKKAPWVQPETAPEVSGQPGAESIASIWQRWGIKTSNGRAVNNTANARKAIAGMNVERGWGLRFDDFLQEMQWHRNGPLEVVSDVDVTNLQIQLQDEIEISGVRVDDVRRAMASVARENRVNSAREWLYSLKWDGVERLRFLMPTGFGAGHSAYTESVGRCFMMGMAKRIIEPGCQHDYCLILEGRQGAQKTSALKVLGDPWFCELHEQVGSLEWKIALQGKILCEISELSGFRASDIERIKASITNRNDRFRSKYGIWANDHPRTTCFAGTTNEETYLVDTTGNRRFWPIACGQIDIEWIRDSRDQMWAEACARVQAGESHWDVPEEEARVQQEQREEDDPWFPLVADYVARRIESDFTSTQVLEALGVQVGDYKRHNRRIGVLLKRLGMKRVQVKRQWLYRRETTPSQQALDMAESAARGLNSSPEV